LKILIFVDHDIIAKNFILNGALDLLNIKHQVLVVLPTTGSTKRVTLPLQRMKPTFSYIYVDPNIRRVQIWRWLLFSSQLRYRRGEHERAIRHLRRVTLGPKASLLLTLLAYQPLFLLFTFYCKILLRNISVHQLLHIFELEQPDIIFHPTVLEGLFVNDLIELSKHTAIPTVFAMNSWDNPSTKRSVVGKPDHLLVWGNQTKEHAIRFLNMPPLSVHSFGSPQLDRYTFHQILDPPSWLESDILEGRHVILYAGSNTNTNELSFMLEIDEFLSNIKPDNLTFVYRPHPWGHGGLNGNLILEHSFKHLRIDPSMLPYLSAVRSGQYPIFLPDPNITHSLLSCATLVISPLSTILLEAALLKKSIAVHLPSTSDAPLLANGLPMLHFDEFLGHPSVRTVNTAQSIFTLINNLLSDPFESAQNCDSLYHFCTKRLLSTHPRPWSERIVDFLDQIKPLHNS